VAEAKPPVYHFISQPPIENHTDDIMIPAPRLRPLRSRSVAASLLIATCLAVLAPGDSSAQLRPLVRDMLENVTAVNRIAEGLALDDWDRIEDSARGLRARADSMQLLDLETLRMDRSQDALWDAFLQAQEKAAREISVGVRNSDANAVIAATQTLVGNACLGCHASFRDPQNRLRGSVLFMTSFLAYWQEINRGLMIRDFDLIGRRARELSSLTAVVGSDENVEAEFGLGGPRQQREFRAFLAVVTTSADAIAAASDAKDPGVVLQSSFTMWGDGCIGCHVKFRR
jgi:cytochrome c556